MGLFFRLRHESFVFSLPLMKYFSRTGVALDQFLVSVSNSLLIRLSLTFDSFVDCLVIWDGFAVGKSIHSAALNTESQSWRLARVCNENGGCSRVNNIGSFIENAFGRVNLHDRNPSSLIHPECLLRVCNGLLGILGSSSDRPFGIVGQSLEFSNRFLGLDVDSIGTSSETLSRLRVLRCGKGLGVCGDNQFVGLLSRGLHYRFLLPINSELENANQNDYKRQEHRGFFRPIGPLAVWVFSPFIELSEVSYRHTFAPYAWWTLGLLLVLIGVLARGSA